jgi:glycosyltransferase involved in cell wall biosynthesis
MRVGFFTYGIQHADRLTGIARYTTELTRALRQLDPALDIVLLSPYPNSALGWYREFETVPVPGLGRLPAAATLGNISLHRAAVRARLDVLHDPCGIAPFLYPLPGVRRPYARVVTIHDVFARVVPQTQDPLMRLLYATLLPLTRRTADAVLTVSEASLADLRMHLHLPQQLTHATPLGVRGPAEPDAEAVLDVQTPPTGPYFLYVGNLTPRKNLRRVLEAFALVQFRHPDTRLLIVGPKFWGSDEISALAAKAPGVTLTGFVSDEALDALYAHAQALVFPSLYEGFGLPALEAMVRGCPVIASDTSSLPEVVGDAGLQVDPLSVDAIAGAMLRVLEEPGLHADLAARGRQRAALFSWRATAEKTRAVYEQVVQRVRRP